MILIKLKKEFKTFKEKLTLDNDFLIKGNLYYIKKRQSTKDTGM